MMESQVKTFLKRIGKSIAKEEPTISDKDVQGYIRHFIQELPNGDVREALIEHKQKYTIFLSRCIKKAAGRHLTYSCQQNEKGSDKKVAVVTKTAPVPPSTDGNQQDLKASHAPYAAQQQVMRLLQSDKDVEELERLVEELWVEDAASAAVLGRDTNRYCLFLMLTNGCADLRTLKNIMALYFNSLQDDTEEIIAQKSKKRAGKRSEPLVKFLKMCHLRRTLCEEDAGTFPSYADLVTAMLSIYLDLFIVAHRDEEVVGKVQRQTCSLVKQLTADAGEKSLDTVLQMSAADSGNCACLAPLVRYLLREKPAKRSHSHYLRYVLTVCMWRNILSDIEDLVMETRMIRAPKGFVQWVIEWQPLLNGEFPDDRKFKGRTVTAFLLDDADDDMLALLKDAIANAEKRPAVDQDTADETEEQDNSQEVRPSGKKLKKKKRKKAETKATAMDNDEAAEDNDAAEETEDVTFTTDVGEGEATVMSGNKRKRKPQADMEVFDLSNLASPDGVSDNLSGSWNADSLFVVDRGAKSTPITNGSDPTQEPKKKKKKKKKTSDTNGMAVEEISQPVQEVSDSADGGSFFVDRGARRNAVRVVEQSAGVEPRKGKKTKAKGQGESSGVDSGDGHMEAVAAGSVGDDETVVVETSDSGDVGACTMQADSTVLFSIDRGDNKAKRVDSPAAASGEAIVKTRLRMASEESLSGQKPSGDQKQGMTPSESLASCQGVSDERQHRRRTASERLTTDRTLPSQSRRRSASERSVPDQKLPYKRKSKVSADSMPAASDSVESKTVLDSDSLDSQSNEKSAVVTARTSARKSGISSKALKKVDLEEASESSRSPLVGKNAILNTKPSSTKSQKSSRVSEEVLLNVEVVPDSDVEDVGEGTGASSGSIVPNSVSETDSQNEASLVPDLRVHLKLQPPQTGSSMKSRRSLGSTSEPMKASPALKEMENSATPGLAGSKSPASLAAESDASASARKKDSKLKRKRNSLLSSQQAGAEDRAAESELENLQSSTGKGKSMTSSRPAGTEGGEVNADATVSSTTPQGGAKPRPTKPKSTTPVSRRTRARRSMMGATPVSSSTAATDTKSESPTRTTTDVKTQPDPSAKRSRRTSLPGGRPTSLLSATQKKATRRSVGFDLKTSEPSHSRKSTRETSSETKMGFTSLKEIPQSSPSTSVSEESTQAKEGQEGSPGKLAEVRRERNLSGSSPGKKGTSATQTSAGHAIETRSRSPSKGYNLRRSGKFQ